MKILLSIPRNLRTVPMNTYVTNALRQLGHEVIVFNYQYNNLYERIYKKISLADLNQYKNRQLLRLVDKEKPDLFFSIYGQIHTADDIRQIRAKGIRTASWWLNDPFQLPFKETDAAPAYDFYFSNSRGTQPQYRENGVEKIHFLPVGIDPHVHRKLDLAQKKYEIVFVGDHHVIRQQIIEGLINKGFNIAILGPWRRKLEKGSPLFNHLVHKSFFTPEQMVQAFNDAKIVLNIHTWMGRWPYGINPRLFEAAGCGAFQISDVKDEMRELFHQRKDIVWFDHLDELPELLHYYLKHDAERNAIAMAALETARHHTYIHRMEEMLSVVGLA